MKLFSKKCRSALILSVFALIVYSVFLFWFGNITGNPGLFAWHPEFNAIFIVLICLVALPVLAIVFLLLAAVRNRAVKGVKIFAWIADLLCILVASGFVGYCVICGHYVPSDPARLNNPLDLKNPPSLTHIAVSSDPHWHADEANAEARSEIIRRVGQSDYDAFFCLGDISDFGSTVGCYEEPVKELNAGLKDMPVLGVLGNHDALINGRWAFQDYFNGNPKADLNYAFTSGKVHFIVLNLLWGDEEFTPKEREWLIKQLSSIPKDETVVVMSHCFYVSSGYYEPETDRIWYDNPSMMANLCPIFEEYGVDLVLSGHNHLMEVLEKNGVTYAIIGAMGGKPDPIEVISPYSKWLQPSTFGWMDITFAEGLIFMDFKDQSGKTLATYTVSAR